MKVQRESSGKCFEKTLIRSHSPVDLYKWQDKVICIKRIKKKDLELMDRRKSCPEDFIRCSKHLCVHQDYLCPITELKLLHIDEMTD